MISKLNVPFLGLNLAIYAGFAVVFLAVPVTFAEMIGIQLKHSAALADFRAMYGGLCLAISVVLVLGILKIEYRKSAMLLAVLGATGLLLGRLITLVLDGPGNLYIYASISSEVLAIGLGLILIRKDQVG